MGDRTSLVVRHDLGGCLLFSACPLDPRGSSSGGVCSGAVTHGKPVWLGSPERCTRLVVPKTVDIFVECDYMFERPSNCAVCNNC